MKSIFIFQDNLKDNISYYEKEPVFLVTMNRSDLAYLKNQEFANYPAIYVLIGANQRYVGQAAGQTIYQRLSQHFLDETKAWVQSILFFSRTDGKLSKADTDYLERKLIQDFKDKSEFQLTNSTIGNTGYINKLSKAQSDMLYNNVFEIIDQIANIDLFEDNNEEIIEIENSNSFSIEYDDQIINAKSARRLFIDFVTKLYNSSKYSDLIKQMIVDDIATSVNLFGRKRTSNSRVSATEIDKDVWLHTNMSRKTIKNKIEQLATDLNIDIKLNWK